MISEQVGDERRKKRLLLRHPLVQRTFRYGTLAVALLATVLAVSIVTSVTVDLGPALRELAEREGSKRIERPMRIGSLSVRLFNGRFVIDDFTIEGLTPADRPFLRAKRIEVSLAWQAMFHRELLFDSVEMTDWQMTVETFENGRHTFPRFASGSAGARRFTTTVQYVRASRGEFTLLDHATPWSTVARNLDVRLGKVIGYRGEASFSGGTVQIQRYEPMRADMKAVFRVEDGMLQFERIDLRTDGAESILTGTVDIAHWPEQTYQVRSLVHFPRMREIFFARETFSLFGDARFDGVFHLYKGGRSLTGTFASDLAGVNDWRFPDLQGALEWVPDRFEVTHATAAFYGGTTAFGYLMAPLGRPQPATAVFDAEYRNVNLAALSDSFGVEGVSLAGYATGRNRFEWPLGRFRERIGDGRIDVAAPPGVSVLSGAAQAEGVGVEPDAGEPGLSPGRLPFAGHVSYRLDPDWVDLAEGRFSTASTDVTFGGRTSYGERSGIQFHVTSADWQESDRVLAGIMTAFGSRTGVVPVGGSGRFTGVMLGAMRRPRVEGTFEADQLRAFDVDWGSGRADLVIENSYAEVTGGRMQKNGGEIAVDGLFSIGFPRRDGGEELNTRVRIGSWSVADLRHAFDIDDYRVDGVLSGEYHVYGRYQGPFGFGTIVLDRGLAYGEPFEAAEGSLRFEGNGVRIDAISLRKGEGSVTGAAFIGWNGTYSFNADGQRVPLDQVAAVNYPRAPLSGLLDFDASGSGTFEAPRYEIRARIGDLFVADEGVGEVVGRLDVRGPTMTVEFEAASPRLAVSGTGRIGLSPEAPSELTLRFTGTSLDPYARAFEPRLSPFTTAVGSGTIRLSGELSSFDRLLVEASLEELQLRLFDYPLHNATPVRIVVDRNVVRVESMRLLGEGTELEVDGSVDLGARRISGTARGNADLGILQGFYRDIRSAGQAQLSAEVSGPLDSPTFFGAAAIANGRIRHFSLPHALEAITGRMLFDARSIRLDDLTARLGQGDVSFEGRIGLEGYAPSDLALTATGRGMQLRYPEGVRSVVDADLRLTGRVSMPTLTGTVTVQNALWTGRFNTGGGLLELTGGGTPIASGVAADTLPLRLDVRVVAPGTFRIDNNVARISSSADLTLRGTYQRPIVFGRAEITKGEVIFEGRRYLVNRGTLDFTNPVRIEPLFDVEAETNVRVPGQTYRVTLTANGTMQRLTPVFTSDPPLPEVDIVSLLFGDAVTGQDADLRALRAPNAAEQQLIQARAARLLASPISQEVGRVVEETFGVDTFQLTPLLADPYQQSSRFNPSARLTIGKRVSTRLYLTFSRSLNASTRDQIVLLEYDQSDRVSWVLTRNEDETYSLDMRVRHQF